MQVASKKVGAETAITYPHCPDTEAVVLGCMLLDFQATKRAMAMVSKEDFYTEIGQAVFLAIANLVANGTSVDMLSVTNECRSLGTLNQIGGAFEITKLTRSVGSTELVERDCLVLKEFTIKRMSIQIALATLTDAQSDTVDPLQMLDALKQGVTNIYNNMPSSQVTTLSLAAKVLAEYEDIESGAMVRNFTKTGIEAVDNVIGGLPESGLIMVLAAPSVGKTTIALQMCINMAKEGTRCSFISLETNAATLARMLVSNVAGDLGVTNTRIYLNKIKSDGSKASLQKAVKSDVLGNILIQESFGSDIFKIQSVIYGDANNGAKVVFIDYLQLISCTKNFGTDNSKFEFICQTLQNVSQDLKVPIVVLSQLARDQDKSVDTKFKMPKMTDGRSSGMIEQAAVLMFGICLDEKSTLRMSDSKGATHYRYMKLSVLKNKVGSPTFDQHISLVQLPAIYTLKTCTPEYEADYLACCGGDTSNDLTSQLLQTYGIRNPYVTQNESSGGTALVPIATILNDPFSSDTKTDLPF